MKSASLSVFSPSTLALAVGLALVPVSAMAQQALTANIAEQNQRYTFNIAAKPLPQALAEFSAVTGLQVLYTEQSIFSQQAAALNGNFSAQEALQRLTAGSGMLFRFTANGVTLEKAPQQQAGGPLVLGAVTVTAAAVETSALTAPASISIISAEQLTQRGVTDLTEAIRNVPGVAVAGAADAENIFIRGLPAEYTMILIDGKRVNTRESRTNGAGGVDQFFMPPVSAIDRIEVVRGPMSALYGTDAMGGVINIITKTPADYWTGSVTLESSFPSASEDSAQKQLSFYVNGPLFGDKLGLQIRGRKLDRTAAERIENNRQVGPDKRDLTDLFVRLHAEPIVGHKMSVEVGQTTTEVGVRDDSRESLALDYKTKVAAWDLSAAWHLEQAQRKTVGSLRSPETENSILDLKASRPFNWLGEHQLTLGGQLADAELADFNPGLADNITYSFSSRQKAVFAENSWQLLPEFNLTLGARYTDDDRAKAKFTPRLYALWELKPSLFLSAGVSTGFRTPELRESVEGYYMTSGQGRDVILGTADLKPEESVNSELGLRFENNRFSWSATVFATDFKNKISTFATGDRLQLGNSTYNVFQYYNIDKGRSRGAELSARYQVLPSLGVTTSYSHTETEHRSGSLFGRPLSRTPKDQAELQFDWQTPLTALSAWTALRYQGDSVQVQSGSRGNTLVEYQGYTTWDLGLNYAVLDSVNLKAVVYNLAGVNITNAEHGSVKNGRTLWLGLTTEF